jgi:hypothetical protein
MKLGVYIPNGNYIYVNNYIVRAKSYGVGKLPKPKALYVLKLSIICAR